MIPHASTSMPMKSCCIPVTVGENCAVAVSEAERILSFCAWCRGVTTSLVDRRGRLAGIAHGSVAWLGYPGRRRDAVFDFFARQRLLVAAALTARRRILLFSQLQQSIEAVVLSRNDSRTHQAGIEVMLTACKR